MLVYEITGKFNESASNFSSLQNIETLKLQGTKRYMSYETACSEAAVSTITGQDVFVNLANLRYLAIDLVLGDFNPASLRHLREVTLDMSY